MAALNDVGNRNVYLAPWGTPEEQDFVVTGVSSHRGYAAQISHRNSTTGLITPIHSLPDIVNARFVCSLFFRSQSRLLFVRTADSRLFFTIQDVGLPSGNFSGSQAVIGNFSLESNSYNHLCLASPDESQVGHIVHSDISIPFPVC